MRELAMVAIVGGGTLAMRSIFIVGSARLPASIERAMTHAKPAILAALVGSFFATGGITLQGVAALSVATLVALRGGGMLTMMAAGVAVATVIGL
jgi:uncharacterized membrane protein